MDGQPEAEHADLYACIPPEAIQKLEFLQTVPGDYSLLESWRVIRHDLLLEEGYKPMPWHPNCISESRLDLLRTIVATYKLRAWIRELNANGVDFTTKICVPETDSNGFWYMIYMYLMYICI